MVMVDGLQEIKNLNILIIDDDEDDFFLTSECIKSIHNVYNFNIEWCSIYKEAVKEICKGMYDIYFVDYRLGVKTGLDLVKEVIKNGCEEPIILLTGKGNKEIDVLAMQAGAVDYLVKADLNTEKLERCIRYALGRFEFIKALKANEQKFRSFFEKSKDAVFIADEGLYFKDVNITTTILSEYNEAELLKLSLYDLLANKQDQAMIEHELELNGEVSDKEVDLYSKNKEKINCIVSVSKEKDAKGHYYIQGIIHDITTLKKAEKATLQTQKLNAAQRFVRTLAHEVRNPLNNIYLSLEQLAPEITGDESKTYLEILNRNSKRIGSLITELLDSSRPTEIVLEKVSLKTLLDESIATASDRITLKRIGLQIDYPVDEVLIMADPSKLKIAFLNIIINSIEAMPEDTGKLKIQIKIETDACIVSISDNGNGISEDNLTKLFEPYYTSKPNGMGLGLAATLNIIQSHKATIDVKSKLNQGTTFVIAFHKIQQLLSH